MASIPPPAVMVWCNGKSGRLEDAWISPADTGFTLGAGVFETILALDGKPIAFDRHWRRLDAGARVFSINPPGPEVLREACQAVLQANMLDSGRARLRVTVTAGEGGPGASLGAGPATVLVTASLLSVCAEFARAVSVPWRRNEFSPLAGLKCTSYAENLLALAEAKRLGADEAILLNTRGHLCEGATSNLWFVRDGILHTPGLETGCLPGVTREILLEICAREGIAVDCSPCSVGAFAAASEAFLTSATRGAQALAAFDGLNFPLCPGPLTCRLARCLAVYSRSI